MNSKQTLRSSHKFTPNKTAKKEVAHNKRKIKVSLVVYYVETFEC